MGVYDGFGAMMGNYFGQLGASQGYQQAQKQNSDSQAQMMEALFNIAGMHAKSVQWAQEHEARRQQNQQEMDYRNRQLQQNQQEVDYRNRQLQLEQDRMNYGNMRNDRLDALNLALQGIAPGTSIDEIARARREAIDEGMRIGRYGEYERQSKPVSAEEANAIGALLDELHSPGTSDQAARRLGLMGIAAPSLPKAAGQSWWDNVAGSVRSRLFGGRDQDFRGRTGIDPERIDSRISELDRYAAMTDALASTPGRSHLVDQQMLSNADRFRSESAELKALKQKYLANAKVGGFDQMLVPYDILLPGTSIPMAIKKLIQEKFSF